jgi:hypothetical protein
MAVLQILELLCALQVMLGQGNVAVEHAELVGSVGKTAKVVAANMHLKIITYIKAKEV